MEEKICQSCGMPMKEAAHFGREKDGTQSNDFCAYCYENGDFAHDISMNEMIETCLKYLDEFNKDSEHKFTEEEARKMMQEYFPSLKRWKKD